MIENSSFRKDWIIKKHREFGADPILIEKAIYAFELLGMLSENKINFIFKGGSALLLLIPSIKRLSIDIDILTDENLNNLERVFNVIVKDGIFNRWVEDERKTKPVLPKKHFKFYYNSFYQDKESYILLDILFTKFTFPKTLSLPISTPLFQVEKKVSVIVPSINCIVGDKLTAFAPKTIGISYGKNKSMEIIKQLFDLGVLYDYLTNILEVKKTYRDVAQMESSFRDMKSNYKYFLDDTINTSFLLSQMDFKGAQKNDATIELKDGIKRIKSHIVGGKYSHLDAKIDASKVAFLAHIIKTNKMNINLSHIKKRSSNHKIISDLQLNKKYQILNKLKSITPTGFYLWAIISGKVKI